MHMDHDHVSGGCAGSCGSCAGGCEHTNMEKLTALMKYMAGHNASHTRELATLAEEFRAAGNDMAYRKRMTLTIEGFPIAFEHLPGSTIAIGHAHELYETLVRLLCPCSLPSVGRMADIERIVVTDASTHTCCNFRVRYSVVLR